MEEVALKLGGFGSGGKWGALQVERGVWGWKACPLLEERPRGHVLSRVMSGAVPHAWAGFTPSVTRRQDPTLLEWHPRHSGSQHLQPSDIQSLGLCVTPPRSRPSCSPSAGTHTAALQCAHAGCLATRSDGELTTP